MTKTSEVDDLRSYTIAEVMERTKYSRKTIQRLLDKGALKTLGPRGRGKTVRITHASLAAFFEGDAS